MTELRDGIVADDTDPANPLVNVGGAATAVPVPNYVHGYTPADGDKVLVAVLPGSFYLIAVKQ